MASPPVMSRPSPLPISISAVIVCDLFLKSAVLALQVVETLGGVRRPQQRGIGGLGRVGAVRSDLGPRGALACGAAPEPVADAPQPIAESTGGAGNATAADGVPIAFTETGEGSPSLVFIHGWMCDQTYWSEQIAAFSEGHTVVTIDLAGHGDSGMDRVGWPLMAYALAGWARSFYRGVRSVS